MKTTLKSLCTLLAFVPLFIACTGSENGAATISFDQNSPLTITDGKLAVNGSVTSDEGTTIESISVDCLYEGANGQQNVTAVATEKDSYFTKVSSNEYTFAFDQRSNGIKDHMTDITGIKITAKVKGGDEGSQTLVIKVAGEPQPTDLSAASAIEWKRVGGANATGLDQFGLAWTSNTATNAIVKKDAASKFVELSASDWSSITTKEALVAAITAATGIDKYEGISVSKSQTYDVVLAVQNGSTAYIIHLTNATIGSSAAGTTVTITGQSKN